MLNEQRQRVIPTDIEEEMRHSYLDYSMSVIVGRALPDVRDGLKPVHRRIIYAMQQQGMFSNKQRKKSASIVGEVMKNFHPHGDASIYDALVRMEQDFSIRYPLIDGQGNFGSVDGDPPAAMRYTEARMSQIAEELLKDIEKDTVDFVPNYDESMQEPTVLPNRFPNLLVNGSNGIAVGMATNMPTHNLTEVCNATIAYIDNPEITVPELMKHIPGPDFPTGAFILGKQGIVDAYKTGRGKITVRSKANIETLKNNKSQIVITEIPYQVNKEETIKKIAGLVNEKKIDGITDIRDESDREGMRIVIELRRDVVPKVILNQLFKHTELQNTFSIINLALVNGAPQYLPLKNLIEHFVNHRKEVIIRRTKFELDKAKARAHILEGLKIALKNLDAVIKLIRSSKTPDEAKEGLVKNFKLTVIQAEAILAMRLQQLTNLEQEKIENEYRELLKTIEYLNSILNSMQLVLNIIKDELKEIKEKHGDERRTQIIEAEGELQVEDLIADENMVVTITRSGYIKRITPAAYRSQRRGGKGITGMVPKEEDLVSDLFIASTHDYMMFFTDKGRVYWIKVYEIPEAGRGSKGKAIVNVLEMAPDEKISACFAVRDFDDKHFIVMVTANGTIKKTELSAFGKRRQGGIIAITLDENDRLVSVKMTDGNQEILIGTWNGKAIRFPESDVRPMGRGAGGVRGIRLGKGDFVIGMEVVHPNGTLLTATENGYGKRTPIDEYRIQSRGGSGVINIKTDKRNGHVVDIREVIDGDELLMITSKGTMIRCPVGDIRTISRNTKGVHLINLGTDDKVAGVARLVEKDENPENGKNEDNTETTSPDESTE
jgi:DNA gyrase subunit A